MAESYISGRSIGGFVLGLAIGFAGAKVLDVVKRKIDDERFEREFEEAHPEAAKALDEMKQSDEGHDISPKISLEKPSLEELKGRLSYSPEESTPEMPLGGFVSPSEGRFEVSSWWSASKDWDASKVPDYISELNRDEYLNGAPQNDHKNCRLFIEDRILVGWDDSAEELDPAEVMLILGDKSDIFLDMIADMDREGPLYLRRDDEGLDICIQCTKANYVDEYNKWYMRMQDAVTDEEYYDRN